MLVSREKSIFVLRSLYREIRFLKNTKTAVTGTVRQTQLWQKIVSLNRETKTGGVTMDNDITAKNLLQAGESYLKYMRSIREYEELLKLQKGHGERSVEDMAKLMGFSLPINRGSNDPPLTSK